MVGDEKPDQILRLWEGGGGLVLLELDLQGSAQMCRGEGSGASLKFGQAENLCQSSQNQADS